ncbi:MAG TPA: bifunctional nicotinamidase/pyrazinamidase [Deltaproteobacteria bacterium]|nr:bifunctional nicotinamidase/pyrazinamidase [Deltaproteobacteria bacterium]HXK47017.1 bifunctional nicotinamidase/pyrazinamidase [Deltaproteobacteria bacterium]
MVKIDLSLSEIIGTGPGDALVVVDMQNDFMPGGALPVPGGDEIVPGVNAMIRMFSHADRLVVLTQDWHPPGHRSFASAHAGRQPYDPHEEPGIGPVLWPDHCVQGTHGAAFHRDLLMSHAQAIIRKGCRITMDSYSGFLENDRTTTTGLDGYLRDRKVGRVFICGLALDYCAFFTASDALDLGYEVVFILDLARPVGSPPDSASRALRTLESKNVRFVRSDAVRY